MPNVYFDASFGGQPLLIADIHTERGRDIAIQSPSRGSKHVLQDRGQKLVSTTCTILFIDQPGLAPFLDRYDSFRALVDKGEAQIFSHPLDGSFLARAEGNLVDADSGTGEVRCSVKFLAEDEPQTVFAPGGGISPIAGLQAVITASAIADTALAAAGLSSPIPSSCLDAVTGWTENLDLDSNDVFIGVANLTGQISDAIDALDLATDIDRWPVYQAFMGLAFQVARAGETLTADSANVFNLLVQVARPVLAICAEVYGPELAPERADEVQSLNRLRTPGLVPAGTTLKMPAIGGR